MTSRDEALAALAKVIDPELRKPITELGMVGEITGNTIAIKLTVPTCPSAQAIRAEAQAARVRAEVAEDLARESVKNAQQAQAVAREVHVVISQLEPREPPKASFYEPPQMNRYISPILRSRLGAQRGAHRGLVKRKSPSPLTRRRSPPSVRRKMISARRLSAKRRTPSSARRKTQNARRKPKSKSLRRRV